MNVELRLFSGIAPKIADRLLPQSNAQIANNCRLASGALQAFSDKVAKNTNTLQTGDVSTIFLMKNGGSEYWLSWLTDVDCVRSQVAGDTAQRIFWTGDNEPRISNLAMAIAGAGVMPASCFVLGVPAPLVAPTVTPSATGVGAASTRAYVETFVTPWGEEGAPSPVSTLTTGKVDDVWALSALNVAPINTSTISAATIASGICSITTTSTKYLRAGEEVVHAAITGMTDLNGNFVILTVTDATHYTVALTSAQTYTAGGTWTRAAPHNTTAMKRRIYRTYLGSYYFVAEVAIGTATYNDTVLDANLGEEIPSIGWLMPDVGMAGLITLPNGISAGFNRNEVCLSEPWQPHAWPSAYRLACNFAVVAIGAYGSSIVVGTTGVPYVITGSHPSNTSMEKTELAEPCLSKRSMVDVGTGIMYASPNGMAFVGSSGAYLATKDLFGKDEWILLGPDTLRCNYQNGQCFGWHDINAELHYGFVYDQEKGAFSSTSMAVTASYVDKEESTMYVVVGGLVYEWDAHAYNDLTFDWKSKVYSLPSPVNFAFAKIDADFSQVSQSVDAAAADLATNTAILALANAEAAYEDINSRGTVDAHMIDEYMIDGGEMVGGALSEYSVQSLRLTVYADGTEKYSETISNGKSFALPSGYKSKTWEFRLSGNIQVYGLSVAETTKQLGAA